MTEATYQRVTIRPASPEDAHGIAHAFLQSAEHHATLDPWRYFVPNAETIAARYREGRQHPPAPVSSTVTLVAELDGKIVGFVDVRLEQSPDAMHRELLYCHVVEIAVDGRHRRQGIGGRLLEAAEDWGRRSGAEIALLEYLAGNTDAASFYHERMGYRPAAISAIKRL